MSTIEFERITDHSSYLRAVQELSAMNMPRPSVELIAAVSPHLSLSDISDILQTVERGESASFATPPLRVNHGHLTFCAHDRLTTPNKIYESCLEYTGASRTLKSYADGLPKGDGASWVRACAYADKAIAYANRHWPDQLVLDNWVDYVTVFLDDPKDLHESHTSLLLMGGPKTKVSLTFTTSRPWHEIRNDHSAPQSRLIDDAILEISQERIIAHELRGDRNGYMEFSCWQCGSGLTLNCCTGCHASFRDNQLRSGWSTPLPEKLVQYLQANGHTFHIDPALAWDRERQGWEADEKERKEREPLATLQAKYAK